MGLNKNRQGGSSGGEGGSYDDTLIRNQIISLNNEINEINSELEEINNKVNEINEINSELEEINNKVNEINLELDSLENYEEWTFELVDGTIATKKVVIK